MSTYRSLYLYQLQPTEGRGHSLTVCLHAIKDLLRGYFVLHVYLFCAHRDNTAPPAAPASRPPIGTRARWGLQRASRGGESGGWRERDLESDPAHPLQLLATAAAAPRCEMAMRLMPGVEQRATLAWMTHHALKAAESCGLLPKAALFHDCFLQPRSPAAVPILSCSREVVVGAHKNSCKRILWSTDLLDPAVAVADRIREQVSPCTK
jgi:hypothetical protein